MRPTISLTQFLIAVAISAVAVKLALFELPFLLFAPLMYLAIVYQPPGSAFVRFGLCIQLATCGVFVQSQYIWYWHGDEFFLGAVLFPLNLIAAVGFLFGACMAVSEDHRTSTAWTIVPVAATLTCTLLAVVLLFGVTPYCDSLRQSRHVDELATAHAVMDSVAADVQAVCQNLGRAPSSRKEIEKELGRPLPMLLINRQENEIRYFPADQANFTLLVSLEMFDDWRYDSSAFKLGWREDPF